ncbi:DUF1330 domain-containing protein [Gallaecimonas mangrovi]|uniref:DUF1330 domain-containing protein n=1 Tax=Gallaecimonas mangrovi TaxID=2291597 RepID=UPI000E20B86A|nr:DUF1330 domain-containing protein [Gallaecimonas mangrovi]
MTAYFIIDLHIPDPKALETYEVAANPILSKHGAKVLTRAPPSDYEVLEGDWRPSRLVILEYPSLRAIHQFYNDPDFQPAKHARQAVPGAIANAIAIEGTPSIPNDGGILVMDITVHDPELMQKFEPANQMVQKYAGKVLADSNSYDVIEGNWRPLHIRIEQFTSREVIRATYDDPENGSLKAMRQNASSVRALALDRYSV